MLTSGKFWFTIRAEKKESRLNMKKISLHVGMSMCESHVNDAVRKAADVKKVRSSHVSGLTEIICDDNTDVDKIVSAIKNDGYDVKYVKVSDFENTACF